jgi:hypothetical protein
LIGPIDSGCPPYGADIVKTTGPCSLSVFEDSFEPLRKYTPAAEGRLEILPDAITTSADNFEKPAAELSDQRISELPVVEARVLPIERIHVRVAFTVRARPRVGSFAELTARSVGVAESAATCTLTLGGTVTVTVLVRLEDACCALAGCDIIVIPIAIAMTMPRCPTIFRASSYRQFALGGRVN